MIATEQPTKRKKHLQQLAWILDDSIPVPFTRRRIGLDSLIGLVPGIGDAIGGVLSTWILVQGVQIGAPKVTLLRMLFNIGVEVVVGFIPLAGDLFDMGWKANLRNVELLDTYLDDPVATTRKSWIAFWAVLLTMLLIGITTVWAGFQMLAWAGSALLRLFGA